MASARKDNNGYPTLMGISCVDGTPTRVKINPSTGGILTDATVVISFVPSTDFDHKDDNDYPMAMGVSSSNENIVLPWYVNPTNGAVLVEP